MSGKKYPYPSLKATNPGLTIQQRAVLYSISERVARRTVLDAESGKIGKTMENVIEIEGGEVIEGEEALITSVYLALAKQRLTVETAWEMGKAALRIKELLPHGEFKPWVERNSQHARYRQVNTYMKIAKGLTLAEVLECSSIRAAARALKGR